MTSADHKLQEKREKDREYFEDRFKGYLRKEYDVDVEDIKWDENYFEIQKFKVILKDGQSILLDIENNDLDDFDSGGTEEFRKDLLHHKAQELMAIMTKAS